ncbi:hypothetical protein JK628_05995 [Shewanella sp. KX20019]|uniref:hypothetical protein n=1 Tax=Shewanella sp. KX20019 TaxID=2803864 RepID=UPI001925D168|nr:hypothetical protein [Shewanella sp. KX20019]QQX81414.1 hypothetical protein JK628_05995 [Shewanella sp. KX20019]
MGSPYRVRLKTKVKVKWFVLFAFVTALVSIVIFRFGSIGTYSVSEGLYFKTEILSVKEHSATGPARTGFSAKLNFTAKVLNAEKKRVEVGGMWQTEKGDIVCIAELINSESKKVVNYLIVTDEKCT